MRGFDYGFGFERDNFDFDGKAKGFRHVVFVVSFLYLLDAQAQRFLFALPFVFNFQFRIAGAMNPLLKKPVQILAGDFFNRSFQIAGFGNAKREFTEVARHRTKERFVAEHVTQHMQHARAFFVGVTIHQLFGVAITIKQNWAAMTAEIFVEIGQEILPQCKTRFIAVISRLPARSPDTRRERSRRVGVHRIPASARRCAG